MFSFKKSFAALTGLIFLVVVLAIVLPLVGRAQNGGNPFNRDSRRSFYVTRTTHDGSQALTSCANGYHMASMWEIVDTGNLRYNTELGGTAQDSGFGPPTGGQSEGWIRTGGSAGNSETVGIGNCNAWTSASTDDWGTVIKFDFPFDEPATRISPWVSFTTPCNAHPQVWCVQD